MVHEKTVMGVDFSGAQTKNTTLPTTGDFSYLHSGNLPVRHCCTSVSKYGNGRRCGSQNGLMTLEISRFTVL